MMSTKGRDEDKLFGMLDLMVALDKCPELDRFNLGSFRSSSFPSPSSSNSCSSPPPAFPSYLQPDWSMPSINDQPCFIPTLSDLPASAPVDYGPIGTRLSARSAVPCAQLPSSKLSPSSRYKTELCRPFGESGVCKYGEKCQFAHGLSELRKVDRHPKYKTDLCRTFYSTGICPYGSRCHFVHNVELRSVAAETTGMTVVRTLSHGESGYTSEEGSCGSRFSPTDFEVEEPSGGSLFSAPSSGLGGRLPIFKSMAW